MEVCRATTGLHTGGLRLVSWGGGPVDLECVCVCVCMCVLEAADAVMTTRTCLVIKLRCILEAFIYKKENWFD